ncbi:hypothetical protein A4U64_17820 [Rhodococcus sp. WB1]|uniref:hypothetical protein n=1 Tax=Rhodococcus TaxID=1827 RepID=UPI000622CFC6|nr:MULTISPECIES: hypothetical protein [Rhodococcus]AKE88979.1 hypothetical protein AAT18_06735 [Rhodococcus aetherivorans]ANZ26328.1 hypothetical protein A4U64_17820 [Rhodococcus sp. WB1]USC16676.1 hypothetical protein KZJ41_07280 [Rhodococcus sp. 11-3]WFS13062.1 hypothetical protein P9K37_25465 [Rhodococcus aetherivorans]
MNRLSVVDEIFLHRHRGLGMPVALQGLWRTGDTVGAPLLISLHDALGRSPLGRRVVRPHVPGARPRLEPGHHSYPLRYPPEPIPAADVLAWADQQAEVDVNPELGPGWALTATRVEGGGTVVSLVCSHVLADARGLIDAVADALAERIRPSDPARVSDVRDAARLVRRVARGMRRARWSPATEKPPRPRPIRSPARTALLDVDATAWDTAANAAGGTPNSLFLALAAGIAHRAGLDWPLRIAVPVDGRTAAPGLPDDGAGNGVTMTEVVVDASDTPASIRHRARAAYTRRREGAPHGLPDEVLQLLPDRLAARLAAGAGERDLLCSNIGPLPPVLDGFGPHRTTGVATRAVHPGLATARASTSTRLAAYLCRQGDRYTLALVALDDEHFPTRAALRADTDAELAAHGLHGRHW